MILKHQKGRNFSGAGGSQLTGKGQFKEESF